MHKPVHHSDSVLTTSMPLVLLYAAKESTREVTKSELLV